jgi:hypothetical protein
MESPGALAPSRLCRKASAARRPFRDCGRRAGLAAGFFVSAANKAFSSKLKANAAPVDAAADFFKKLRRFNSSDIIFLSFCLNQSD